jgi:hypothetical protein
VAEVVVVATVVVVVAVVVVVFVDLSRGTRLHGGLELGPLE